YRGLETTLQWYRDIHPSKQTLKLEIAQGVIISSSRYRDIDIVREIKLDKKGSLCPLDPPINQSPCRGIF
ncbi:hypothetical protein J1N35_008175, partial [Gossypium stocksii]